MNQSDQDFREQFKPIVIPSSYERAMDLDDRILFALASLGEGSANDVFKKMKELEPGNDTEEVLISKILNVWYDKGLIKGSDNNNVRIYDLSKITKSNTGYVDPELLAPGLD